MIICDIMTTSARLVTVTPEETLGHAALLLRQYQFHHLPVLRSSTEAAPKDLFFEGLISSQDIDLAVALDHENAAHQQKQKAWQDRLISEVMHRAILRVTPTTSVSAAAKIMVERGLNCLPVVEYRELEDASSDTVLVGLVTRSDLLLALARSLGAFEPGMQLDLPLSAGDLSPLTRTLQIADELHIPIRSVLAAPASTSNLATIRIGTINPTPLLLRLQQEGIHYAFGILPMEEENHV
ncbi:CBS domain-containing protein [Tengunoibacter tsumagoiensis]|uniref:CBS domain-containing protein n=1 Tax=Tengunoibacter tsumagoiensis TaxID=2014871 RepID=A0A402A1F6_9CHLR|nr:CBS domain-containing protein [Tengunoibacter tsumagoiensis]GCE12978.1 hypothetical protein KTT_28370 [Tengunoibacter tsumagoiensis]